MTTATPAPPTTLVEVRAAERDRLKGAAAAVGALLMQQQADQKAAETQRDKGIADVAAQDQEASRLRQQLAAAPLSDLHGIELALDAVAVLRQRALREQVDGTDAAASGAKAIERTSAAQSRLAAELTAAEAALTQATTEAAEVEAATKDLDTALAQVATDVGALAPHVAEAQARLDALLGSAQMRTDLAARLEAVVAQDAQRRTVRDTAEEAVRAADSARSGVDGGLAAAMAAHERALGAVRAAAAAPKLLLVATAAVDAARNHPDLPSVVQEAVDAAAAGTDDPTVVPIPPTEPPVTPLENWAIRIPPALLAAATAFVDAQAVLAELAHLDGTAMLTVLEKAQTALVAAVTAQLAAAQAQAEAADAAQAAADEVTTHEATAADRRALAVSGD